MEYTENELQVCKCATCGEEKFAYQMRKYNGKPTTICKDCYNAKRRTSIVERMNNGGQKLVKLYTNPKLSTFSPRELMDELKARGYSGKLYITQELKL